MSGIRAVVFDLDGTLVDSLDDIASAVNHLLRAHGKAELPTERVRRYVGDGARALVARATELAPDAPALEPLLAEFLAHYRANAAVRTRPRPGARTAISELEARFALAIVTNKPRAITDVVLAALDLARHFRVVIAGGDLEQKKPDPAPLFAVAERLGVDATELVMIGDGPQDIECGRAAGARTIGVLGGILPEELLRSARPDCIVSDLEEVPACVSRLAAS